MRFARVRSVFSPFAIFLVFLVVPVSSVSAQSANASVQNLWFKAGIAPGTHAIDQRSPRMSMTDARLPLKEERASREDLMIPRGTLDSLPGPAVSWDRNGIQRHPVWFGTLLGFGTGFLIGYASGDYAVGDFTAEFTGLLFGGIGAAAGALVGWAVSG